MDIYGHKGAHVFCYPYSTDSSFLNCHFYNDGDYTYILSQA